MDSPPGTLALVPQIVDVSVPVIAADGMMVSLTLSGER
jgi:NAD(P)H-dependent flavin oxidoreductase YrpB (nitropropane dioxygenase family)